MLLALETAQVHCSVALYDATGVREYLHEDRPRLQTQRILPMLEAVMSRQGIGFGQLGAIAFARGPGSFSGIRINTAVAQALGWAHNLPLLPVSSLQALAQTAELQAPRVLALVDARMDELYAGAFERDTQGLMQPVGAEQLLPPQLWQLPTGWDAQQDVLAVGDGVLRLAPSAFGGERCAERVADARQIARLGWAAWQQGQAVNAAQALPVYLRDDAWKKIDAQRAARAGAPTDIFQSKHG